MMRLLYIYSFLVLLAGLPVAAAQDTRPSMNPDSPKNEQRERDPFGVNILSKDRPKDAKTEITAKKQATFDNATHTAEFEGNVIVVDPQFTLYCDKLRVLLNKDRKGMERVEAFGNVIIRQESKENKDENGRPIYAIGRSGKAVYEPKTGNITLSIWPSLQRGISNIVSTEEGTIMILNREGKLHTTGGNKTVIKEAQNSNL